MALKTKHSELYRDSWKPLLQHPIGDKPIRRKEKWVHEDKELLYGSIIYKGKHLGTIESENTTDYKALVKKTASNLYYKHKGKTDVDIAISVRSIIVTDTKTKMHVFKQKLQKIAFCSEDKSISDKILALVVKKSEDQLLCYCFETHSLASRITLSVGQAFQLAYERSQEAKEASHIFAKELKKLNAMKGKEDYAKKLEEILISPSEENQEDTLPEMDYSKSVKRFSKGKGVSDMFQSWEHLRDTLKPIRDPEEELPSFDVTSSDHDIDAALTQLDRDLREWTNAKNPYQSDQAVTDALKELDSLLESDSQTLLTTSQVDDDESTEL